MDSPINDLRQFTTLVTGLVLVLNILSLVSIHLLVRWLRNPAKAIVGAELESPFRETNVKPQFRASARNIIFSLLIVVVAVNVLAIFGNYQLRNATQDVITILVEGS